MKAIKRAIDTTLRKPSSVLEFQRRIFADIAQKTKNDSRRHIKPLNAALIIALMEGRMLVVMRTGVLDFLYSSISIPY